MDDRDYVMSCMLGSQGGRADSGRTNRTSTTGDTVAVTAVGVHQAKAWTAAYVCSVSVYSSHSSSAVLNTRCSRRRAHSTWRQ